MVGKIYDMHIGNGDYDDDGEVVNVIDEGAGDDDEDGDVDYEGWMPELRAVVGEGDGEEGEVTEEEVLMDDDFDGEDSGGELEEEEVVAVANSGGLDGGWDGCGWAVMIMSIEDEEYICWEDRKRKKMKWSDGP